MKKTVMIALKAVLVLIFLQNIGFFSFISNMPKDKYAPTKADNGKEDRQFLNEKIAKASKLGDSYGPAEYFLDLTEIKIKSKNNDFDRLAAMNVNSTIESLLYKMHLNVQRHRMVDSEKNFSEYMEKLTAAQQKCLDIIDPEGQKRSAEFKIETAQPGYWPNLFRSLMSWLFNFYLNNLPLALALLWIWWYEDKNRFRISNPLSFLICLIFYPIVIIRTWTLKTREVARIFTMSVDFKRRQADIFSLISENEFADIKRFAKSNLKISDYRNYLINRNLSYQHSFVPVMLITFAVLITSQSIGSEVKHVSHDLTQCQVCIKAPPDIQPPSIPHENITFSAVILPKHEVIFIMALVWQFVIPMVSKRCQGFKKNPDPIPLFA